MKETKLVLLAALFCSPGMIHAVTVITSLPYTINKPGSYELQNNLTANGTDGIDVKASNVSINLAGYMITQGQAGAANGISVNSSSNVSIQNGTIIGFFTAVSVNRQISGAILENLRLLDSYDGVSGYLQNSVIENCFIVASGAGTGIGLSSGGNLLRGNQIVGFFYGVWEEPFGPYADTLTGNYEANCTVGLNVNSGSKYQDNVSTNCEISVFEGIAVGQDNG
jgi:hypothetical protein